MKKKIIAILMAMSMILSVTACKKDSSDETRTKKNTKTEDKDRDDDDDDDDDEEETKKTKKTKATTEETEEPTEEETTTKEETTTTAEETTTTAEETTTAADETTTAATTIGGLDFGEYDSSKLNNAKAKEWVDGIQSNGGIVMDLDTAAGLSGTASSFPAGTIGFSAIPSDYSMSYVYLEIAMNQDFTDVQLKQVGEALKKQGYEVEQKGDCLVIQQTSTKTWGVIDLKTGYYFFAVSVLGDTDFDAQEKLAKDLGFSL